MICHLGKWTQMDGDRVADDNSLNVSYNILHDIFFLLGNRFCVQQKRNGWTSTLSWQIDWMEMELGQCKARPFYFHQVCLFLSFFVSLFQCPNTVYPNTKYLQFGPVHYAQAALATVNICLQMWRTSYISILKLFTAVHMVRFFPVVPVF